MSKNLILNCFLVTVILGIFITNILENIYLSLLLFSFVLLIYLNFIIYKKHIKKYLILYVFLLFWFLSGMFISIQNQKIVIEKNTFLEKYFISNNNFLLEVNDIYKKWENYNSYIVKVLKINNDIVDKNIKWIVYIKPNFELLVGDFFSIKSQILNIDNIDNNFNYKYFMHSKNIYFKIYVYDIKNKSRKQNLYTKLYDFKQYLLSIISKIYPKDEASLLAWILLWARENFSSNLIKEFNNSWTTHIIAVSWFNITILIVFISLFFRFFPLYLRFILITLSIFFFDLVVWFEVSVVRASIVGLLGYIVFISWRKSISITSLFIACFFMLLYNPLYINYDISFQLSFLAVLWIIYTSDYIWKKLSFLTNLLSIKESFVLTISASVFTLPIILFNFWQLPILTPISNILFIWTIPFIMLLGSLSIIFFYINTYLWFVLWFIPFLLLKWDISLVHFFGNLDKFILKIDLGNYESYFQIIYYLLILFLIFRSE